MSRLKSLSEPIAWLMLRKRRIVAFIEDRFGSRVARQGGPARYAIWRYVDRDQRIFTPEATRRIG